MILVDICGGALDFYKVNTESDFDNTVMVVDSKNRHTYKNVKDIRTAPYDLIEVLERAGFDYE